MAFGSQPLRQSTDSAQSSRLPKGRPRSVEPHRYRLPPGRDRRSNRFPGSRAASRPRRRDTGKRRLRMQGLPVTTAGSTVIRSNSMDYILSHHTNDITPAKPRSRRHSTGWLYNLPGSHPPEKIASKSIFHPSPAPTRMARVIESHAFQKKAVFYFQ
jgi:hypothetical protein